MAVEEYGKIQWKSTASFYTFDLGGDMYYFKRLRKHLLLIYFSNLCLVVSVTNAKVNLIHVLYK